MSYQRSWKNSPLEKRNIGENSCLRTGTLTDSKGFCGTPALKRENFRPNKGNIFPSIKSLVSDIPAGGRENRETFFTVYACLSKSLYYYFQSARTEGVIFGAFSSVHVTKSASQRHLKISLHRKKRFVSFPSPAGMSLPNSPWAGIMTS
jgi:hypothetical protein